MSRTTVTSKGQVTIPVDIREALKLRAGDRLLLDLTEDGFSAVVLRRPSPSELRGVLSRYAKAGMSREDEREAVGRAIAEKADLVHGE